MTARDVSVSASWAVIDRPYSFRVPAIVFVEAVVIS